jgi:hypothetical protein
MNDVKEIRSKKGSGIVINTGTQAHKCTHLESRESDQIPAEFIPSRKIALLYP